MSQANPESSDKYPDYIHNQAEATAGIAVVCHFAAEGHRASIPNFNVCTPKGIPIIVTISTKLEMRYSTAVISPPQISQMIFPKNFIS